MKTQFEILLQQLAALNLTISTLQAGIEDGMNKQVGQIIKQNMKTVDSLKSTMQAMIDISGV